MDVTEDCATVKPVLARIGDKWVVLVVRLLGRKGPRRFNELRREIGAISQRMLTLTLRGLERDGLVTRTAYPTIPPKVEYALTPLGNSLMGPIQALGDWAFAHREEMDAARARFDRMNGKPHDDRAMPAAAPAHDRAATFTE
ncbi:helix-turn-helix transcriptional regulator [Phreatobacter aquaticus]|uniref:Helix-turn-helix transcriptional regulator n=1 Tax=Phreatobacter aquaticus TaxID=2570229 RepID=A0A4D7QQ44_9HYPH|nr:helix-turn-helix domain-containing protein [Phreatobacter aquaticus]QCK87746.1 helix-turn-helix transcriptional regulator [Phreatobacter aquaticus]